MAEQKQEKVITVGTATPSDNLGKSIYSTHVREGYDQFLLRAIGASALSQAVKGVCVANGMLAQRGKYISLVPSFFDADVKDKDYTGISFRAYVTDLGK